ncbi:permease prefix domain 1-containing protein [Chloroflexota bacterium]
MTPALALYLESVRKSLRLEPSDELEVLNELETHIEDKIEELREAGLSEEEAAESCVELLGSAKIVAGQLYEARSQGTWGNAILAAMPHLLFASLFVLNWLQGSGWIIFVIVLTLSAASVFLISPQRTIYRWLKGKPTWLFSWLGYSLLPVATAGFLILSLPPEWLWLAVVIYIPLAVWLLYRFAVQNLMRDWLYTSLMLLPMPIVIAWLLIVKPEAGLSLYTIQRVQDNSFWIGMSILAVAATVTIFIRLRQRWLRGAILLISGLLTISMICYIANGRLGTPEILILILLMLNLLLGPALLERKLKVTGS